MPPASEMRDSNVADVRRCSLGGGGACGRGAAAARGGLASGSMLNFASGAVGCVLSWPVELAAVCLCSDESAAAGAAVVVAGCSGGLVAAAAGLVAGLAAASPASAGSVCDAPWRAVVDSVEALDPSEPSE